MNIFSFSVGSEAKRVAVRCVFAIGVVCWANCFGQNEEFVLTVMYPLGFVYIRGCGPQNLLEPGVSKVFLLESFIFGYIYIHIYLVYF